MWAAITWLSTAQLQAKVITVEDVVRANKEDVTKVTDKVEKMEQNVNSLKNSDRSSGNTKDEILREMAERKAKKANIVIQNLLEPDHTVTDGESRNKATSVFLIWCTENHQHQHQLRQGGEVYQLLLYCTESHEKSAKSGNWHEETEKLTAEMDPGYAKKTVNTAW